MRSLQHGTGPIQGRPRSHPSCDRVPAEAFGGPSMSRRCPRCGLTKPDGEFVKSRATKSGYHGHCKLCHLDQTRESIRKHHGTDSQRQRRRRYGVDNSQIAWMVLQQGGCAICGSPKATHVDHDHRTGRVRGVLCFNCNNALGHFDDDPKVLAAAADYLEGNTEI
ncbi:MAG: recombinase [Actinobacteria bacterium]|nr:recombinase [Actinomycetota bacterium]